MQDGQCPAGFAALGFTGSQRHARDLGWFAGQYEEHVVSSLVTPKVRKIKSALLLDFRPQVGATVLNIPRVLVGSDSTLALAGFAFRS